MTGRDLRNAKPSLDENNQPAVSFSLNNRGRSKFSKATGDNVGRNLAIVLDGQVRSAPRIESRISDEGQITGSFTQQEAQDLVARAPLGRAAGFDDLPRGADGRARRLGADSIRSGVLASLVGLTLVVVVHAVLLPAVGHQRDRRARPST